jgi:hypothetical protein
MAFLLADCRGLLTKAWCTCSIFSGVLSEGSLPGCFHFRCRSCLSEVSHPQQYSTATRNTVVPMNTEVPTKYPLSHSNRIVVFEIGLHSAHPTLYWPALHGNWNALSLARRELKENFPMLTVPLTAVLQNRQVFLPNRNTRGNVLKTMDATSQTQYSKSEYCN